MKDSTSLLIISVTLYSLSQITLSNECGLISSVCSTEQLNQSVCFQSLNSTKCDTSDPNSNSTNLRCMGRFMTNLAINASTQVLKMANHLPTKTKGHKILPKTSCLKHCGDTVDRLKECLPLWNSTSKFNLSTINTMGSGAETDLENCKDEYGSLLPKEIGALMNKTDALISVILVISNML